ncbi:hypothetical protein [Burkholderia multivorans]|uniref:hypothetical protein n=1 Tax=Burkholderia multivorans TaxID=87883 RepID=UPI000D0016CE|nr:hypothetical protein [Burkholderia multivorans]MBU9123436.1 hypothetical protein [Burkholderia multivorans]PRF42508.1 hypothetical protein C6Q04_29945 [Burkholderia multivorans]PRG50795.1 hypothetical protein C6T63_17850 [Burkholderia multivorans]
MHEHDNITTPQMARAAERIHLLIMVVSGAAVITLIVGCVVARDWIELLTWTALAAWGLFHVAVLAFLAGVNGGFDHA